MRSRVWAEARKAAKAVFAGITMFVGSTAAVLVDDRSLGDITDGQWFTIAGFTLAAFGGVYGIRNAAS